MSDTEPTRTEQTTDQTLTERVAGADWRRYGVIALAAVIGLIANSLALLAVVGGDLLGIADGVAYLAPVVVLAGVVHDRYNPIADLSYIGPLSLFATIGLANTISLSVKVFRMGGQSSPGLTLLVLAFLALLFTPGAFLGVWATRRWGV
jgi:hypothetical protein